jgi:hypothetical protein
MGDVGYQVVFYIVHYDTHGIDAIVFELLHNCNVLRFLLFPSSNCGSTIFPFTISNTLFLERMKSILVFHALKLEAPSNLFSEFIEYLITYLTRSTLDFDEKLKLDI